MTSGIPEQELEVRRISRVKVSLCNKLNPSKPLSLTSTVCVFQYGRSLRIPFRPTLAKFSGLFDADYVR
jgi:hypothetical protein